MKRFTWFIVYSLLSTVAYAYTITHSDYTSGGTISASGQNTNENNIVNVINGNLDTTNIAANGVGTTQIAAQAVTAAKIANNTITASQIANNTITDTQISTSGITAVSIASGTLHGSTANSGGSQGLIQQGTISTPDLRANAVTQSLRADDGSKGGNGASTADSQSITTIGGPVLAIANIEVTCTAGPSGWGFDLCISTSTTCTSGSQQDFNTSSPTSGGQEGSLSSSALMSLAAGTYTVTSKYSLINGSSPSLLKHSLTLIELRD